MRCPPRPLSASARGNGPRLPCSFVGAVERGGGPAAVAWAGEEKLGVVEGTNTKSLHFFSAYRAMDERSVAVQPPSDQSLHTKPA